MPRGRGYRYPSGGRNMPDGPMPGGMVPVAYDMNVMPYSQPMSAGQLATSLANATPAQQRTVSLSQYLLTCCYVGEKIRLLTFDMFVLGFL